VVEICGILNHRRTLIYYQRDAEAYPSINLSRDENNRAIANDRSRIDIAIVANAMRTRKSYRDELLSFAKAREMFEKFHIFDYLSFDPRFWVVIRCNWSRSLLRMTRDDFRRNDRVLRSWHDHQSHSKMSKMYKFLLAISPRSEANDSTNSTNLCEPVSYRVLQIRDSRKNSRLPANARSEINLRS